MWSYVEGIKNSVYTWIFRSIALGLYLYTSHFQESRKLVKGSALYHIEK